MDYKKIVVVIEGVRYGLVPLDAPALKTPIETCELSTRGLNALKAAGVTHLEQVASISEFDLLRLPNFGRKYLTDVREALKARGLRIGQFKRD